MISKKDLMQLYEWAISTNFPLKKVPTSIGYSNKDIYHSWIKGVGKNIMIRNKLMTDKVYNIYKNENILYSTYSIFEANTILKPHKDPNVYREPYKRVQIPLEIPDKEKCYMIWQGKKIFWKEGVPQVFEVMDYIHEGYNLSESSMKFLFLDIKKSCDVEL